MHAPIEQLIVAASWICPPITVSKRNCALAETFEHHYVKFAALRQIDGGIEPVGGKARASANSKVAIFLGHKGLCLVGSPRPDGNGRANALHSYIEKSAPAYKDALCTCRFPGCAILLRRQ